MTVELRPLGVACNLACGYCYQNPLREAGNIQARYDLDRMKAAVLRDGGPFILFGGEPLLLPIGDLEDLFAWGLERFGENGLQTNAALITDAHIDLFLRYKVRLGVSIDGPGELNDLRWAGTLARTREMTAKSEAALDRLVDRGVVPTVIVTLHRGNATTERLPRLSTWLTGLDTRGIKYVRLHLLEVEDPGVRSKFALSTAENLAALTELAALERRMQRLRFDIFTELENLLLGKDAEVSCVWRACDPFTTPAVSGVEGHGQRSNCSRTNKEGIDFVKADIPSYDRYLTLYNTPHEYGGCANCRFFLFCKGQCPGTAIEGDWRNRTEHCEVWMRLFEDAERSLLERGLTPLSQDSRRPQLEQAMLNAWASLQNPPLCSLLGLRS